MENNNVYKNSNNSNYLLLDRVFKLQKQNLSVLLSPSNNNNTTANSNNVNTQNIINNLNETLNCLNELLTKFQSRAYQSPPQQQPISALQTSNTNANSNNNPNSNSNNTTIVIPTDIIIKILVKLSQTIPTDINYHKIPVFSSPINLSILQLPLKLAQIIVLISRYQNSISFSENLTEFETIIHFFLSVIKPELSTPPTYNNNNHSNRANHNNNMLNTVNTNLRIESLKALSSLLHNNGPNIHSKLQQPLIDCLLDLSNYSDFSIDQETKRIATVSLGNLCMQCGTKLSKFYIQIFDRLYSNLERATSQINNDKYLIKFTSSILRSLQLLISQAKGVLDQKAKSLYNILKTLMFYGINISSSMSSVLTYQYQFEYSKKKKLQQQQALQAQAQAQLLNNQSLSPAIVLSSQCSTATTTFTSTTTTKSMTSPTTTQTTPPYEEIERSTGITSSDSDIDERYNLSKLRFLTITLLNTMVKHSPKIFFGYWPYFLPSTPFPLTPTVFTLLTNDPDIKIKIVAANFLQTIIDGSKDFLVAVNNINSPVNSLSNLSSMLHRQSLPNLTLNDMYHSSSSISGSSSGSSSGNSNNHNNNTSNSFTTFSQSLTSILKEIHNGLIMLLVQDPQYIYPSFHQQVLRCVSTLIVNCPYEKLNIPSLLTSLLTSITPYIQHKDHSIQLNSLICVRQLFDQTPLSPNELSPVLKHHNSNGNNIIDIIINLLNNNGNNNLAQPNSTLINDPHTPQQSNNPNYEYIKIECIQIYGALTKHNFAIFLKYSETILNQLISILKKEISIHNSGNGNGNLNNNGSVNGNSSNGSTGLNESSIANCCLKTFEEITKAIQEYYKNQNSLIVITMDDEIVKENVNQLENQFWNQFFNILPSITIDPYPIIRSSICNIFSNISFNQFESMMVKNQQMHLVSVVLGLIFDESHIVRAASCRSVGILIKIPTLHDDAMFLSNAASCLTKSMSDQNINVKIKACWSLANLCDHLVSLTQSNNEVFNDIPQQILSKVLESLLNSSFDNPKIRSNVVRALGNFARFANKSVLYNVNKTTTFSIIGTDGNGSEIGIDHFNNLNINNNNNDNNSKPPINSTTTTPTTTSTLPTNLLNSITLKKDSIILDRIVDSLLKNAQEPSSSFNFVKVKWNACYALGNIFYNDDIEFTSQSLWLPEIYSTLISLMKTCKNFKTRINATASLATQTHSRLKYGIFYKDVLDAVLESLNNINTVTDTSEFQYRDNLEKQLEIALIHLISEMESNEIYKFNSIFFEKGDIIINSFSKHQIIFTPTNSNINNSTSATILTTPILVSTNPNTISTTTTTSTSSTASTIGATPINITTTTVVISERPTPKEYQKALDIIKEFCNNFNNIESMSDTKKLILSQLCLLFDFSETNYQEMCKRLQEERSNSINGYNNSGNSSGYKL